ncbi:RND transporter [Pseudoalteromonas aurantia]|uniref:RND transporter n=2 Tax=Pseudoalteromonas aurantia TaxID=43654 RepID=A0A5S3VAP7_9GAMM|nr:RND transporter [Pseudoalteromonas aurantia]
MDTVKHKAPRAVSYMIIVVSLTLVGVCLGWVWFAASPVTHVKRTDILVDTVKRGPVSIKVSSFGKLHSAERYMITSESDATVEEVLHQAGSILQKGQVIARLSNPDLQLQVKRHEQLLQQAIIMRAQLQLTHQRELLLEQAEIDTLIGDLKTAELEFTAQQALLRKGIISMLTFLQVKSKKENLTRQLSSIKTRFLQLEKLQASLLQLAKQRIDMQSWELTRLRTREANLTVKAPQLGVLQRMPLTVGQSVKKGAELALLGSPKNLTARLKVPQSVIAKVAIGQNCEVRIREHSVAGVVQRISSQVENNSVEVEVSLQGELPLSARPLLNIDAEIIVAHLHDALYMLRPAHYSAFKPVVLYKILAGGQTKATTVSFDNSSGKLAVIADGASAGEQFIISDLTTLAQQGAQVELY